VAIFNEQATFFKEALFCHEDNNVKAKLNVHFHMFDGYQVPSVRTGGNSEQN
jgi:hypothetical protein